MGIQITIYLLSEHLYAGQEIIKVVRHGNNRPIPNIRAAVAWSPCHFNLYAEVHEKGRMSKAGIKIAGTTQRLSVRLQAAPRHLGGRLAFRVAVSVYRWPLCNTYLVSGSLRHGRGPTERGSLSCIYSHFSILFDE